ncbi:MAG: dihydrolipoyl dehydrogenase [Candidatus Omnitrophota bacterium]
MYDLAIIGSGWAGFSAAIYAKELGLSAVLIEKNNLGGTCLNQGCIPTKTLVHFSKNLSSIKNLNLEGIEINNSSFDFQKLFVHKENIVNKLKSGLEFTLKNKKIDFIKGLAALESPNEISIDKNKKIQAKFILIATGSRPIELDWLKFDQKKIISSDDLLNLKEVPKTMLVIGGGVIGSEFAQIYNAIGVKITIVEITENILPTEDKEATKKLELIFKKTGINILTKTDARTLNFNDFDKVLVCVGRRPAIENLGLENLGINQYKNRILVNDYLQTNIPTVYAAGDCIGGMYLAHVASHEGKTAAYNMFNLKNQRKINYKLMPTCVFTDPEVASIGLNEEEAKAQGFKIKLSKFSFLSSGMAHILNKTDGFIKIVSDLDSDEILGASILGPQAIELINIFSLAMANRLKISQIKDTVFCHPSLSETIIEALRT